MTFLDDFMTRALLAGVGTALACGVLGCFVVWRRMAYFGDATAHAAILGVALALAFETSIIFGVLVAAIAMALLVGRFAGATLSADSLLGVLSHSALALGLVAVSVMPSNRIDLDAYLFGDILVVSKVDLLVIWLGAATVIGLLIWRWQALLAEILSPDLAFAAGLNPSRDRLLLTLLIATVVAVSLKVVGALLITAMLIIPAATARLVARTPEAMAVWATGLGITSATGGLYAARFLGTPAGPSIICGASALFLIASLANRLRA